MVAQSEISKYKEDQLKQKIENNTQSAILQLGKAEPYGELYIRKLVHQKITHKEIEPHGSKNISLKPGKYFVYIDILNGNDLMYSGSISIKIQPNKKYQINCISNVLIVEKIYQMLIAASGSPLLIPVKKHLQAPVNHTLLPPNSPKISLRTNRRVSEGIPIRPYRREGAL